MTKLGYKGLKAGLEIHQQLDTSRKLFCHCPAHLVKKEPDFEAIRYFRPTLSETGKIDPTALKAFKRGNKVVYQAYNKESCLYELNEAPPSKINKHALETAFFVSKILDANIPNVISVSRKQYLDGSVPAGFQRTMIVGFNGLLELSSGKQLKIEQICLEEDASRKMKEQNGKVTFRVDRLGIPLVEITTAPQLKSPAEVRDAALRIGSIFRSTGEAKRGIGSIRQDVNLSIEGGSRVEIKGVQRPSWFKPLIKGEIKRQQKLKEITQKLKSRKVKREQVNSAQAHEVSSLFKHTGSKIIQEAFKNDKRIFAVRLPGFKNLLAKDIQKGKTFGKEFGERVSSIVGLGGIIHTDELPAYGINVEGKKKLFDATNANRNQDTIVVVIGKKAKAEDAIREVKERAIQSLSGVPRETRRAHKDGTTSFERPLGTAARLYPDTDTPPIRVKTSFIEKARDRENKFVYPWEKKEEYRRLGISKRYAKALSLSRKSHLFDKIIDMGVDPKLAARILLETFKELKRSGVSVEAINDEKILEMFHSLDKGDIAKEAIPDILTKLAENPELKVKEIIESLGITTMTREQLEEIVEDLIADNSEYISEEGQHAFNGLMGDLMKRVKGKIDGEVAAKVLRKKLKEALAEG